jgi:SAM-dependent methyltransferase
MSDVFRPAYAAAYDRFYGGKDYAGECDVIERVFAEFSSGAVDSVADFGCGTGGHAIPLAVRGYHVIAVERAPAMLGAAKEKAHVAGVAQRIELIAGDFATVGRIGPTDAALMMFNVLGYQASPAALSNALASVRRSLKPDGLFVFDAWHAVGVEQQPPAQRLLEMQEGGVRIQRLSSGTVDRANRICTVVMRVLRYEGDRLLDESMEEHRLRYFARDELESTFASQGLELVRWGRFPSYWEEPHSGQWPVFGVARARA